MNIDGNATISLVLLLSVFSLILSAIATFSGTKKNQKDETEKENERRVQMREEFVKVNLKLDVLCRGNDDITKKIEKTANEMNEMKETIMRIGMKLDDHEKRIGHLERGE